MIDRDDVKTKQLPLLCRGLSFTCAVVWIALVRTPNQWHVPRAQYPAMYDYYAGLLQVDVRQGNYGWLASRGTALARHAGLKDDYAKLVEDNIIPMGEYPMTEAIEKNCKHGLQDLIPGNVEHCNNFEKLQHASNVMLFATCCTISLLILATVSCTWGIGKWCLALAPGPTFVGVCVYGCMTYTFPGTKNMEFPYTFGPCFFVAAAHALFTFVPACVAMYHAPTDELDNIKDLSIEDKEAMSQSLPGEDGMSQRQPVMQSCSDATPLVGSWQASSMQQGATPQYGTISSQTPIRTSFAR